MRERLLAIAVAVLVIAGALAAATSDGGDGAVSEPDGALAASLEPAIRDSVAWVLAYVNSGAGAGEIGDRFSASFLRAVPAAQLEQLVASQIRPAGPFRVVEVVTSGDSAATLRLLGTAVELRMEIAVEPTPPHRITGLVFRPASLSAGEPVASWDDLEDRLRGAAAHVGVLAAEIVDGECRPVHALDADRVLPLGSAFKLYVLGALAGEIAAGRASWAEPVTVTDADRVHTSMHLGAMPDGAQVSLREAATAMISVSDNTATDLVMARVGRDAVEAVLAPMGMAAPASTLPFLTTAEMTRLKFLGAPEVRDEYAGASVQRRREILASLPAAPVTDEALLRAPPTRPVAVDAIEWFASATDLCRAHVALRGMGPEVRAAMTQNAGQGIDFDRQRWPEIAFKGGSEPGVLAGSWSMRRDDGREFALVVLLMDTERDIPITAIGDAAGAFALLAATR